MADLFISYSRKDQPFVRRLSEALVARGRETWVDWEGIAPSAKWMAEIRSAIEGADTFVFVISPDSVTSNVCQEELDHAAANGKRIVPLLRHEVTGPLPESVASINWISLRDEDDFEAGVTTLITALDTDLDHVRTHTRLLVRAKEWDGRLRGASQLLRGSDLTEAETWLAGAGGKEPAPTPLHAQYVLASRRAASRRQRVTVAGVSVALLATVVLAVLALIQRGQAVQQRKAAQAETRIATQQRLVAQSQAQAAEAVNLIGPQPDLALLLARQAALTSPTSQAVDALRSTLLRTNVRAVLQGARQAVFHASFNPDGKEVAGASYDGTVRIWDAATGRTIRVLGPVTASTGSELNAAWSPNGRYIATSGELVNGELWDATTGARLAEFKRLESQTSDAEFSPDGTEVVTAENSGAAYVWQVPNGGLMRSYAVPTTVGTAEFSPDGSVIVTSAGKRIKFDGTFQYSSGEPDAYLLDPATGAVLATLHHPDTPVSAHFSPDGSEVVTACVDGKARVWSVPDGRLVRTLTAGSYLISARFSPDGRWVATAGGDGVARVFDWRSGTLVSQERGHTGPVYDARFAPDSRFLLTSSTDDTARVWEAATGNAIFTLRVHTNFVYDAEFSPDGRSVVTASEDHTAVVWDVSAAPGAVDLQGNLGPVNSVAFSPSGGEVATASEDQTVRLWSAVTGGEVHRFCCHLHAAGTAFSSDGRYLAAEGRGMDYTASVWDVATDRSVAELPGNSLLGTYQGFLEMSFGADRTKVLTADWQGGATLWNLGTGKPIRRYVAPASPAKLPFEVDTIDSAEFSPDGSRVLTAGFDLRPGVFDAATGRQLVSLVEPDGGVYRALYSHDGATILTLSADGGVRLWDAETGRLRFDLPHPRTVLDAAFSPDDSVVATSAGKTVRLWDARTGRALAVLSGHTDDVVRVAFSPDGRYLATGSSDRTVRVWSVATRRQLALLHRTGVVTDLAFSPDGGLLASSGADGSIEIVRHESFLPLADLLGLAAHRVTRGFTAAERERYLGTGSGSGSGQGGIATAPPP